MAKTRSQNRVSPEEHKVLQPHSRKVNKNKKTTDLKIKNLKIVVTRLSCEDIERAINEKCEKPENHNMNTIKNRSCDIENNKNIRDSDVSIERLSINMNAIKTTGTNNYNISPLQLRKLDYKSPDSRLDCTLEQKYHLRKREKVKYHSSPKVAELPKTNKITKKKPIVPITALFNICRQNNNIEILIGQLVLAKMHSYSPWPAKVMEVHNKNAVVFFFGTNSHGTVKIIDCVPIEFCGPVILRLFESKQANLRKAIEEMKVILHLTQSPTNIP